METGALIAFVVAGWLLNFTPGPDVLCITTQSMRGGLRAGVWAALGVTAGCIVHVFAAGLGLGAVLSASAWAFGVLKWMGAAYLLWVGVWLLCLSRVPAGLAPGQSSERAAAAMALHSPATALEAFRAGFLTNVLNPKVALFFLAFVPQFIPAHASHPLALFLALGLLFNVSALPVNLGWAWLGERAAATPGGRQAQVWLDRCAGLLFIGFGARLAWSALPPDGIPPAT